MWVVPGKPFHSRPWAIATHLGTELVKGTLRWPQSRRSRVSAPQGISNPNARPKSGPGPSGGVPTPFQLLLGPKGEPIVPQRGVGGNPAGQEVLRAQGCPDS
jgi:hypothetical protein